VSFKDHFSERAALYAAFRPHYPAALFDFVATLPKRHALALDCGTGNGQAALGLTRHFRKVIAIDPSREQIRNATPHPRIDYRIARADSAGVEDHSVDLLTVAQALHWFEPVSFFGEAKRVLRDAGAIAIWGYGDPALDTPELQETLHVFNRVKLEPFWFAERKTLLRGYRDLEFPFDEIEAPALDLEMRWTLPELTGYLRTWSATANYVKAHSIDPVTGVEAGLAIDWGDPSTARVIKWPLYIRAGRVRG
jgi:SAM-dependent methyltransferase